MLTSIADRPTSFKVAALLLPLSIVLYVASLTMNVARVTGNVGLNADGIREEIKAKIGGEETLTKVSAEITAVISGVVREKFPMFANPAMLNRISGGVDEQVRRRGPSMVETLVPHIDVPQPAPEVRLMKLLQTIRDLWNDHDKFLATCLVMFTIFFPISKYIALISLLMVAKHSTTQHQVVRWLKNWGQWSMGDVFVVAFLVVYLRINTSVISTSKLADIAVRVDVEPGMYLFAASVILAMICSMLLTAEASADAHS
ncbi:MAG: paraquat-inducible protein A [Candidatus Binatia bacterium]